MTNLLPDPKRSRLRKTERRSLLAELDRLLLDTLEKNPAKVFTYQTQIVVEGLILRTVTFQIFRTHMFMLDPPNMGRWGYYNFKDRWSPVLYDILAQVKAQCNTA